MHHSETNLVNEIKAINENGYGVLVAVHKESGEEIWGEACALPAAEMEAEMAGIGYSTEGMMSGDEYLRRWDK
jgi:hypothetical protein